MSGAHNRKLSTLKVDEVLFNVTLAIDLARAGHLFEDDRGAFATRSWDEELEGLPWAGELMSCYQSPAYATD